MVRFRSVALPLTKGKGVLVIGLKDKNAFDAASKKVAAQFKGLLESAVKNSRFSGEGNDTLTVPVAGVEDYTHVVMYKVPDAKKDNPWVKLGVALGKAIDQTGSKEATFIADGLDDDALLLLAEGVDLGVYRFDRFKTGLKAHQKASLATVTFAVDSKKEKALKEQLAKSESLMKGVALARDLVNLPPNIATPDLMVEEAKKIGKLPGIKLEVLGEKQMKKLGLNLLVSVGKGSVFESRLILMKYTGDKKSKKYKAIVGKGVMFDTGGYNLKPSDGMAMMKCDMAGAAAVMGAMSALAERKAPVNVIGVVGTVMNMVDADANLPSCIETAYNGKTVEIMNTDAEGRLVLADAMAYLIDKEKPTEVVNIATLTGAIMVSLGGLYAGLFSKHDTLAANLQRAGERVSERLWRMPLDSEYAAKPTVADLNNDGSRFGGSSTAAVFLSNFVGDTPWAHLDIAGVAMSEKIPGSMPVTGASGFGVRLFVDYLESNPA